MAYNPNTKTGKTHGDSMPKLDQIEASIKALEAKIAQAKALKTKTLAIQRERLDRVSRKDDARKKILVGAMVLAAAAKDPARDAALMTELSSYLNRPADRALFGISG